MLKVGATLALAVLGICAANAQIDPNKVVVVINGQEIKGAEYYRRMENLTGVGRMIGNQFVEFTPGMWTIEQLVTERLVIGLAREKSVFPTDAEVQAELRYRLEVSPTLLQDWEASGQTRQELEHQILIQLCQFKIATAGINVTDQEVDKFYKDNPFSFTIPKRVKLRVITVSDPTKKIQVDGQLKNGAKFEDVAKSMSEDISKVSGGDFGTVPINSMQEPVRKAIEAVKIGQTTAWVEAGQQSLKFLVENVIPEQLQPMDAKLRRSIRHRLMMDRGKVKNDIGKEMKAFRAKTKIDVKDPGMAEEWARMMRKFGNTTP